MSTSLLTQKPMWLSIVRLMMDFRLGIIQSIESQLNWSNWPNEPIGSDGHDEYVVRLDDVPWQLILGFLENGSEKNNILVHGSLTGLLDCGYIQTVEKPPDFKRAKWVRQDGK